MSQQILAETISLKRHFSLSLNARKQSQAVLFLHAKLPAICYIQFTLSLENPKLSMATPTPASKSYCVEGTIDALRSDFSSGIDPKCLDTSIKIFFTTFCNIQILDLISNP